MVDPLHAPNFSRNMTTLPIIKRLLFATTGVTVALVSANTAEALTLTKQLQFNTSNQSIWDNGDALGFVYDNFLGTDWSRSGSFGTVPVTNKPILEANTSGKVGLQTNIRLTSGTVSAAIPINLFLDLPDVVNSGETFTIKSGFTFDSQASFQTISPDVLLESKFIFNQKAEATLMGDYKLPLIDVSSERNLFDPVTTPELSFGGDFGSINMHVPKVETQGAKDSIFNQLVSQGENEFLTAALDLDKLATTIFPEIPPLGGSIKQGNFDFSYDLLDAKLEAYLKLQQAFSLTGGLSGSLNLGNGLSVPFTVGSDVSVTVPEDVGSSLELDLNLGLDANLRNLTSLAIGSSLNVAAGKFSANVSLPFENSLTADLGPLFQDSFPLFEQPATIFDKQFSLAGFNQQALDFTIPVSKKSDDSSGGENGNQSGGGNDQPSNGTETVLDSKTIASIFTECLNDGIAAILGGDPGDPYLLNTWNDVADSFADSTDNASLDPGSVYEMTGLSTKETADSILMVLRGNLPLTGTSELRATDGNVNWGDLFINQSGLDFNSAMQKGELSAIHFTENNNSGVSEVGFYNNVIAKSVTAENYGWPSLQAYNNVVGANSSLGDLPSDTSYFAQTGSLNEIESGKFITGITYLTDSDLASAGYDFNKFPGSQIVAFKFDKSVLAKSREPKKVSTPESSTTFSLILMGLFLVFSKCVRPQKNNFHQ